jgi:hypothetical protein
MLIINMDVNLSWIFILFMQCISLPLMFHLKHFVLLLEVKMAHNGKIWFFNEEETLIRVSS